MLFGRFDFQLSPSVPSSSPPLSSSQTLVDICRLLPETKVPELVVSLVALSVLIVVKEINACYRQKLPLPIPIELIMVSPLLCCFLFFILHLHSRCVHLIVQQGASGPQFSSWTEGLMTLFYTCQKEGVVCALPHLLNQGSLCLNRS